MFTASQGSCDRREIERICSEHRLPLTTQRRMVLETLPSLNHPTVDEVWDAVRKALPEISRTTVYRILETFAHLRVVRRVCHPGAVARYENRTSRHHHLLCLRCGKIADTESPAFNNIEIPGKQTGFHIEDYSIQFRGLCTQCVKKQGKSGTKGLRGKGTKGPTGKMGKWAKGPRSQGESLSS